MSTPVSTPYDVQRALANELGQAAALRHFAATELQSTSERKKLAALVEEKVLNPVHKLLLADLTGG